MLNSMKKKLIIFSVICVLLIGLVGITFFNEHFFIVRSYKAESIEDVWKQADMYFVEHLNYASEVLGLLDAADSGDAGKTMSAYSSYERMSEWIKNADHLGIHAALGAAEILRAQRGVFTWSMSAFQPENYERLVTYAEYSTHKYQPYCERIAALITDQAAYETYGKEYISLLRKAVESDVLVSTSLYQLVYRELFGYRDIRKDGKMKFSTLERMAEEDQQDLLHLSPGDLWDLYFTRLEALWKAENQLAAYCEQMEL